MNKGQHASLETRVLMSAIHKGIAPSVACQSVAHTPETWAKISASERGKVVSPESRAKMSASKKGHPAWNKGKPMSGEQRQKLSAAKMGRRGADTPHWKGGLNAARVRVQAWRLTFGFNPLNSPFFGCEGHHIDKNDVIFIPKKLHHSVYHNQHTGQGMVEINALAGAFLTEDLT